MPKNIIMCLDGTGNKFKEDNTNVVKLYKCIVRDENQVAYYDAGVGTLADPQFRTPIGKQFSKLAGLGFGVGLMKNVEQAYSYLMEHYEANDRILIFGFSRGAYTARVLAAYVHAIGLLESGNQNLIPYASKMFRARKKKGWIFGSSTPEFGLMKRFKATFGRDVKIQFLGLWDSVSTYGWIYNPVFLPYTTNNESVKAVRHAIAIDERRALFPPMPWGDAHVDQQDVKQVWFAGVHSDVGGGYAEKESGLSKIALKWMIDESEQAFGLNVDDESRNRYIPDETRKGYVAPDAEGQQHESLKGVWWLAQFLPTKIWLVEKSRAALRLPKQRREINEGATLHSSVLKRLAIPGYRPPNLGCENTDEAKARYAIEP